jgi:hypothetical protein
MLFVGQSVGPGASVPTLSVAPPIGLPRGVHWLAASASEVIRSATPAGGTPNRTPREFITRRGHRFIR